MFAINHAAAALVLKRRYPTVRMVFISAGCSSGRVRYGSL